MDKHLIFYAMFIPSLLFFLWGMWLHINLYLQGTIKGVPQGTPWPKIKVLLLQGWRGFWARPRFFVRVFITDVIFHRKLLSQSFYRWLTHSLLVFGFVATFIVDMIKGFTTGYLIELSHTFPFFSFAHVFETGAIRPFLDFFLEFFSFLILVGCVLAIVRRFVLRPSQLRNEEEDIVTLLFILFLEISGFFIEGYRIAHPEVTSSRIYMANFTPASANSWVSFGDTSSPCFLETSASTPISCGIRSGAEPLWLIYIPHSKLLHIFTSSVTVIADRAKQMHLARLRFPSQTQVSTEHEHSLPAP